MHVVLSAVLLALAILDLVLGTSFLVDPSSAAADFGLDIVSRHGESTLRGDMTAFFYITAISLGLGGWKRRGDMLWPALGLFGIAFSGRLINLVAQGPYEGWMMPMAVEGFHCLVIIAAMRAWGRFKASA